MKNYKAIGHKVKKPLNFSIRIIKDGKEYDLTLLFESPFKRATVISSSNKADYQVFSFKVNEELKGVDEILKDSDLFYDLAHDTRLDGLIDPDMSWESLMGYIEGTEAFQVYSKNDSEYRNWAGDLLNETLVDLGPIHDEVIYNYWDTFLRVLIDEKLLPKEPNLLPKDVGLVLQDDLECRRWADEFAPILGQAYEDFYRKNHLPLVEQSVDKKTGELNKITITSDEGYYFDIYAVAEGLDSEEDLLICIKPHADEISDPFEGSHKYCYSSLYLNRNESSSGLLVYSDKWDTNISFSNEKLLALKEQIVDLKVFTIAK